MYASEYEQGRKCKALENSVKKSDEMIENSVDIQQRSKIVGEGWLRSCIALKSLVCK